MGNGKHCTKKEKDVMRTSRILLAVVLVAGLATSADAANKVWWEATANPLTGAGVTQQGIDNLADSNAGNTQQLQLTCDNSLGLGNRCEWDVVMRLRNDEYIYGWAVDLSTPDVTVSAKNFEYGEKVKKKTGYVYYPLSDPSQNTALGNDGSLVQNAGAFTTGTGSLYTYAADGNAWSVFRFTLSKDKDPFTLGLSQIFAETGGIEWAGTTGGVFNAEVGGNPSQNIAFDGTAYGNSVITIQNVPEPATMVLFGVGALCLLRRRR
jgi:hypothetical protein